MCLCGCCARKHVSALCQRVTPFKTLHSLCTSGLCQRVTLFCEMHSNKSYRLPRDSTSRMAGRLCVGKHLSVVEGDLEFGVLAVEIVLQTVEVAAALPLAHRQIVEQTVAAGLRCCGRHLRLGENPL